MERINIAGRMKNKFFSDKVFQNKGFIFYRFLVVFIQDEDLFEEIWCIFIYDTSSKEMTYLFKEQNDQSLNKLKQVETNCLSAEWKGLRTQAVSKSKNGKLLKSHYFLKKPFL